jgi:hypothetical protein
VEVYQGTERSDALVAIPTRTTIESSDGRTVRDESTTLEAATFVGRRNGLGLRLPLATLAPGHYLLRVNATRDSLTISRTVAFVVE